jgi:hypothetical protein
MEVLFVILNEAQAKKKKKKKKIIIKPQGSKVFNKKKKKLNSTNGCQLSTSLLLIPSITPKSLPLLKQ